MLLIHGVSYDHVSSLFLVGFCRVSMGRRLRQHLDIVRKPNQMHPPLDRPHPDCQNEVNVLKACHNDGWKKFYGACNVYKVALDQCFKYEKERLLHEMNRNLVQERQQQEVLIQQAFGKNETFTEYLRKDGDYLMKQQQQQQQRQQQQQQQQ
jgi:COX assembly mitochondrial protein 2